MIASTSSLTALRNLGAEKSEATPARAAREFEAMMVAEMMRFGAKPLFGEEQLLDGGSAGRMAREQLFTQLALEATRGEGLGLARELEAAMRAEETRDGDET